MKTLKIGVLIVSVALLLFALITALMGAQWSADAYLESQTFSLLAIAGILLATS